MMKALWDMGKDLLEEKPRPYLSVIIYIICGLIELLCIVSVIAPFHVSINFLDNIKWARSINDNDLITRVTFWSTIVYLGVFLARKEIDRRIWRLFWGKKEILLLHVSAIIYTIDNLIELLECADEVLSAQDDVIAAVTEW